MPGPLVHRAVAQEVRKLLKGRYPVTVRLADYMAPDIAELQNQGTHPGWNQMARTGNLVDTVLDALGVMLMVGPTNSGILTVSHLIADAHMITQICPAYVHLDDEMDVVAEFVPDKRKLCGPAGPTDGGVEEFERRLRESIRFTHDYFGELLGQWGKDRFVAKYLEAMTRRCVANAAFYTYWLALEAGL